MLRTLTNRACEFIRIIRPHSYIGVVIMLIHMHQYQERKFNLPELQGLSPKQIEVHLKLYAGYVKFTNHLREVLADLRKDTEKNAYALGEVVRRLGFEFNGMRLHEYYFGGFEGSSKDINPDSPLAKALVEKYGSFDEFIIHFKSIGLMRGIGWSILYYDPVGKTPHVAWVGDHELGMLAGLPIIAAMDMWEHAYMVDYVPAEKTKYVEAYLANLNWEVMERRFEETKVSSGQSPEVS